jgi:hypothetical protein
MDDMIAYIGIEYDLGFGDQHPPPEVHNFYKLLIASGEKLHSGTDLMILLAVTRLMGMKSKYNFLNQCYNDIVKLIIDLNPTKIDVCEKNNMLFWKEHKDDIECMHCGRSRYLKVLNKDGASVTMKVPVKQLGDMPITLILKWLYLSKETVKQMRWHNEGKRDNEDPDIMSRPADRYAWEAMNRYVPEFAWDARSVCLGLSMDGFQPHSNISSPYSCSQVFLMPYNLPPNKCLKQGFIFLARVILDPKEPKKQMNIFLCPLMEEIKELWQGVHRYDSI